MFLLQKLVQIKSLLHLISSMHFLSLPTPHVWFFREKHHN